MRIHVLSDLHVEFAEFQPPATDADIVVLAGDVHVGNKGIEWAAESFAGKPVVYVAGNHEFYGQAIPKHIEKMRAAAEGTNVVFLENDTVEFGGVTFAGTTLWTDFRLFGDPKIAGYHATQRMTDFRLIRLSPEYCRFRSIDAAGLNAGALGWLKRSLADLDGPSVVITHHAPSVLSIPQQYQDDFISAAYASNFEDEIRALAPELWIHGHVHEAQDYQIGRTRIVANPRGYPDERRSSGFDVGFVVEVE